jgi:hypothetical protein
MSISAALLCFFETSARVSKEDTLGGIESEDLRDEEATVEVSYGFAGYALLLTMR